MTTKPRAPGGFTLVELMIVLVVIAILSTIAVTQYGRYAFRARRGEGQQLLMRVANAQERYYATLNKYGGEPVTGDLKLGSVNSENGYYQVVISTTDITKNFTATANPIGVQARDACGALSIDSTGTKLPASTDTAKNKNGRCW